MCVRGQLGDMVKVMNEVHGFAYLDFCDLTGFIDGTENPRGIKDRTEVALIDEEDAAFAEAVMSSPSATSTI
jgi:putative iron-dependent peroxidase